MDERWTLDALLETADSALEAVAYEGPASRRVREKPDKRTVRYYTTLGLLDRPAEFRGRTAYYGRRHVLQLTAIKRLQAKGMSLVQIQEALGGASEKQLQRWAGVPSDFWNQRRPELPSTPDPDRLLANQETPARAAASRRPSPTRSVFWREPPDVAIAREPLSDAVTVSPEVRPIAAMNLAPGVTLLLESVGPARLDPEAADELRPAAEFLLAELRRLRLIT